MDRTVTATRKPLYLNLDALERAPLVILEVDGVKHEMHQASVGDFIETFKELESLSLSISMLEEVEVMTNIICRGFRTLSREDVLKWPMDHLQQIALLVRSGGAEIVGSPESVEKAAQPGNSQPAT